MPHATTTALAARLLTGLLTGLLAGLLLAQEPAESGARRTGPEAGPVPQSGEPAAEDAEPDSEAGAEAGSESGAESGDEVVADEGAEPEADAVLAPERKPDPRESDYFETCDHDANGWLSYREMRISLGSDRAEYQLYDTDRDGRVRPDEFVARFRLIIQRLGGFRPPTPYAASTPPGRRTPQELRNVYDADGSGTLDASELSALLEDYHLVTEDPAQVLAQLDDDESGVLEMEREGEAVALAQWLEGATGNKTWDRPEVLATTIDELFGEVTERKRNLGTSLLAPQIIGPVTHFRRLDLDADGRISTDDLAALLAPARIAVQLSTVIASLDRDGDGLLSEAEFNAALGN